MSANEHRAQTGEASPASTTVTAPKTSRWRSLLFMLLCMLGGGVVGALGFLFGQRSGSLHAMIGHVDAFGVFDILLLPLSFFIVILLHELGHLAGGMTRGMRFMLLIVGPLRLRRTVSGLKLDWFARLGTFGGLAVAMPAPSRNTPREFLPLVIGGPLVSLLLAVLMFALMGPLEGRWALHAAIVGALSALIFVATAIPMRAGGFLSDGMQVIELLRGGDAVEQRHLLVAVYGESLAGVRPRDRDAALLERGLALTGHEPLRDITLWLMAYHVALDRRELDQAGRWLDRVADAYEQFPAGFRQALACEAAFFAARYRGDLANATLWYARAKGGMVEASSRALAEAAIAWRRGDADDALAAVVRGERKLGDLSDAGTIPLLQDELSSLRADAEALREVASASHSSPTVV